MKFKLEIDSSNEALDENEVARLLTDTAKKVAYGSEQGVLNDINGNKVGTFSLEVERADAEEIFDTIKDAVEGLGLTIGDHAEEKISEVAESLAQDPRNGKWIVP